MSERDYLKDWTRAHERLPDIIPMPVGVERPHPTQHPLRRLGVGAYLLAIARSEPARVRQVPVAAIMEEASDGDGEFSLLRCPCGAQPIVREELHQCPGCERWYVRIERGQVYVAYGAMAPPPLA